MSVLKLNRRFGQSIDITNVATGDALKIVVQPSEFGDGVTLVCIEPNTVNREHKFEIHRPDRRPSR